MRRPPKVLRSHIDRKTYKQTDVVEAQGVFVVALEGIPIGVRHCNSLLNGGFKYPRSVFTNKGYAQLLANKLNKLYRTEEFKVMEVLGYMMEDDHE